MDGNNDGIPQIDTGPHEFNPHRCESAVDLNVDVFVWTVRGEPGRTVRIDVSRDLVNWETVATVPIPASGQTLIDPAATAERMLFYRAVTVP